MNQDEPEPAGVDDGVKDEKKEAAISDDSTGLFIFFTVSGERGMDFIC